MVFNPNQGNNQGALPLALQRVLAGLGGPGVSAQRQPAAQSPLLRQIMARKATQGPPNFRGMHPLAAAMHGITQGLERRALNKAEKERQKQGESANTALTEALAGKPTPEFEQEPSFVGPAQPPQPPADQQGLLQALMQHGQAADPIATQIAMQRYGQMTAPQEKAKPVSLPTGSRLVDPATGKEIVPAVEKPKEKAKPQRMQVTPGVVVEFGADGKERVYDLRKYLPNDKGKKVEPTGHMATEQDKNNMGLSPHESYWIGKDGKPVKVAGTTDTKAAKIAQLEIAQNAVNNLEPLLFESDAQGNVGLNRKLVAAVRSGTPGYGQTARGYMRTAIDAYLRATSGAAVPETEVERAMEMFFPATFQGVEDAQKRIFALRRFLSNTQQILAPGTASKEDAQSAQKAYIDSFANELGVAPPDAEIDDLLKKYGHTD